MDKCPACGSHRVFRSKTRSAFERFRRQLTLKHPYRCHGCGWRGWAAESLHAAAGPSEVVGPPVPPPDLAAIDMALGSAREEPREKTEDEGLAPEPQAVREHRH
jgi:predicted RNA-binding Zn-ribbon protein involved in translation (DUF1610 family)